MNELAIVIPTFRRKRALHRLLGSLSKADLSGNSEIVISIEGDSSADVVAEAEKFASNNPRVKIIKRQSRLGLREHILTCGDLTREYGGIVLLEEDLMVDPNFLKFSKQAVSFYENDASVAGVALYSPEFNEFAGLPFRAMASSYDAYFIRTPCSWGQAWTSAQWLEFKDWLRLTDDQKINEMRGLPMQVKRWPSSSWKRLFAAYMVDQKKDFVYPYLALSTNCADTGGTHMREVTNNYQVALGLPGRTTDYYRFAERLDSMAVSYDPYMEASADFIYDWIAIDRNECVLDLYGAKEKEDLDSRKWVITSRSARNYSAFTEMRLRPAEMNLRFLEAGQAPKGSLCAVLARGTEVNFGSNIERLNRTLYFLQSDLSSLRFSIDLMRQNLRRRILRRIF